MKKEIESFQQIESGINLSKEKIKENFNSDVTITFMRHGQPQYTEKEKETADWEGTLTEKGEEQVRQSALKLAEEVKKNNEVVIIRASKRTRADESARILSEVLESEGIIVLDYNKFDMDAKHKPVASLKAPDVTKKFWNMKPKDEFFVRIWLELNKKGELPEGVETPEEAETNFKRVLEYNRRAAKIIKENPEAPKIRIINLGHFETVTPLLQEAYGGNIGIDKEVGLGDAEYMNVNMQLTDDKNIKSILKVDYEKGIEQDKSGSKEVFLAFNNERDLRKIE